jgi:hypothetical protein
VTHRFLQKVAMPPPLLNPLNHSSF